nr:LytTR family DNA-binding domain-containing protein [uncultured Mogibacterium sp.]
MTTFAPSAANSLAIPTPIPLVDPVTTATLSCNLFITNSSFKLCFLIFFILSNFAPFFHRNIEFLICLSTRGSNYKISIDTILYIESNNRILTIHTLSETYQCYEKLNTLEEHLTGNNFLRCHQSYLVAINQIIGYNNQSVTLRDTDTAIPVSRQYQKKTRDFLKNQPSCGTLICTCGIYEGSMIRIKAEQRVNTRLIPKQVYLLNPETELSLGDFSTTELQLADVPLLLFLFAVKIFNGNK